MGVRGAYHLAITPLAILLRFYVVNAIELQNYIITYYLLPCWSYTPWEFLVAFHNREIIMSSDSVRPK